MSDHGVVVLTGQRLLDWILAPRNQALLSPFLRQQLVIAKTVSEGVGTAVDLVDATDQCLARDPGWMDYYQRQMNEDPAPVPGLEDEAAQKLEVSLAEARYGQSMWDRRYADAESALGVQLDATFAASRATGAWHALWLGSSYQLLGDMALAQDLYQQAHRADRGVPPYDVVRMPDEIQEFTPQIIAAAQMLRNGGQRSLRFPRTFDRDLAALDGSGNSTRTEAALESLGQYLGLDATRPDKERGTGPDVLWVTPDQPALLIEAKTDKQSTSTYSKRDLGQVRDYQRWVRDHVEVESTLNVLVGPIVPASAESNPDPDMMVIELVEFRGLRDRLRGSPDRRLRDCYAHHQLAGCARGLHPSGPRLADRLRSACEACADGRYAGTDATDGPKPGRPGPEPSAWTLGHRGSLIGTSRRRPIAFPWVVNPPSHQRHSTLNPEDGRPSPIPAPASRGDRSTTTL